VATNTRRLGSRRERVPRASADALRHVLLGGDPSVKAFAAEVADTEGGDPLPAHRATKIIGEVLAEIDADG
jgi:hypothetical protein